MCSLLWNLARLPLLPGCLSLTCTSASTLSASAFAAAAACRFRFGVGFEPVTDFYPATSDEQERTGSSGEVQ
jgi:hypothetical protein